MVNDLNFKPYSAGSAKSCCYNSKVTKSHEFNDLSQHQLNTSGIL